MIITECYKDKALVYVMGFPGHQVRHEFGRSRVLGKVVQQHKTVIGIIDEDPRSGQHPKLKEYKIKEECGKNKLLTKREKRLIQISPYLEEWLYLVAKRNQISLKDLGLPDKPRELHRVSMRNRKDNRRFRNFLIAINKTNDKEIEMFRKWIKEAIE